MKKWIWVSLLWLALATWPISEVKANNFAVKSHLESHEDSVKNNLLQNLNENNSDDIYLQWNLESLTLVPISARIVTDAALSYFDEEVKLYSLKWEERKQVEKILMDYLTTHPILKKNSKWEVFFVIDNKSEFTSMIKNLANTLFDWMPKIIRDIAVLIAFGWNDELQKKLDNLDSTVMNLPLKQYKNIVFDYFWWVVKRICSSTNWKITVRNYYASVHKYYPNKNHDQVLNELNKTWQLDDNIIMLKYPFKFKK